jgi:hypothetical protein
MTIHALQGRIDRMIAAIDRRARPRLINCTGAKEQLLARLQRQAELSEQDQAASEQYAETLERLHAALQQGVEDIEQRYNVRLVSEAA